MQPVQKSISIQQQSNEVSQDIDDAISSIAPEKAADEASSDEIPMPDTDSDEGMLPFSDNVNANESFSDSYEEEPEEDIEENRTDLGFDIF